MKGTKMKDKLKKFYDDRQTEIKIATGVVIGIPLGVACAFAVHKTVHVVGGEAYEDKNDAVNPLKLRIDLSNGTSNTIIPRTIQE